MANKLTVTIEFVKELPSGDCGDCTQVKRNGGQFIIRISEKNNRTLADFGSTMLHELLHLWVFLMNIFGYKIHGRLEHKFIYAVESVIVKFMELILKEKPRGKRNKR